MTPSLFTDFLKALGVPHTEEYSREAFASMTFKSVFGLTKLLQSYGVDSEALRFTDKEAAYTELPTPVLVQLDGCFAIVTAFDADKVIYGAPGSPLGSVMSKKDFIDRWTGVVLIAYPTRESCEPDIGRHRFSETVKRLASLGLWIATLVLLAALGWGSGMLRHPASTVLIALNLFGVYISAMLVQKSAGVHTRRADAVCSIIERTGCNTVLSTSAAKLGGVVNWSAVGLGYFSVNILALLLVPGSLGQVALLNLCCLPFSFWSIWYQHWRAGAWCTLCLLVQATLWCIFFADLAGGYINFHALPWCALGVMVAAYVFAVLAINRLTGAYERLNNK